MKKTSEQDCPPYPLIRVITFGEFTLERLVIEHSESVQVPNYTRISPEEWGNRNPAIMLLKILLCCRQRRASREDLIATIWPERSSINAEHAFDSAASILRRRVLYACNGKSLLQTHHMAGTTSFKLASQQFLWVDADALLTLSAQALHANNQGQNSLSLLEQAHALVRGEFLEDDLHYTWSQKRRHTLNGARKRMLYKLVEQYLEEKRVWQAEELLYSFLEEDPTDEDALCRLMTLLAKQDRRQEALQIYRYTVDILHEERSELTAYTKELATRIRNGAVIKEQATNYVAADTTMNLSMECCQSTKAWCKFWLYAQQIQMIVTSIFLYSVIRRWYAMRMEVDKISYGNYKFEVELDTGAETGTNQLTVWFAEKMNVAIIPLAHFKPDQLLRALQEPYKSSVHTQLEHEKRCCRRPFEEEITSIQGNSPAMHEKKKLPGKIRNQIKRLHKQMNIALQRLEADFMHRALLTLDRSCFDPEILQQESQLFEKELFLRDFYFEESNKQRIRNFCRKFATDEAYRQQVLTKEISWAKRNALFLRNLFMIFGEHFHPTNSYEYENKAREFFHWIDKYYETILALPEYQRLQQLDNAFLPNATELDPFIKPAVELLNRIPGVVTRYSCQGVSGKIYFHDCNILVVSEHEQYAYVSFSKLEQPVKSLIEELLPSFPAITNAPLPGNFALWLVLRSTGDNIRFRTELLELARRILDHITDPDNTLSDREAPSFVPPSYIGHEGTDTIS